MLLKCIRHVGNVGKKCEEMNLNIEEVDTSCLRLFHRSYYTEKLWNELIEFYFCYIWILVSMHWFCQDH